MTKTLTLKLKGRNLTILYLAPKYIEYKTNAKWFQYDDVVEFKLKRKTVELSFDQFF